MSRPLTIHEAAAGAGDMSIEDFAETDAYKAGVADGSIVAWVRTGPADIARAHEAQLAAEAPAGSEPTKKSGK